MKNSHSLSFLLSCTQADRNQRKSLSIFVDRRGTVRKPETHLTETNWLEHQTIHQQQLDHAKNRTSSDEEVLFVVHQSSSKRSLRYWDSRFWREEENCHSNDNKNSEGNEGIHRVSKQTPSSTLRSPKQRVPLLQSEHTSCITKCFSLSENLKLGVGLRHHHQYLYNHNNCSCSYWQHPWSGKTWTVRRKYKLPSSFNATKSWLQMI